jgi:antitoxin HigA-1
VSKSRPRQRRVPPTHPGEVLREEFLKPKNLSQVRAAQRMKMSAKRLNEIICERRGITADTAIRLSKLFPGVSPQFWLNLQNELDLYYAQLEMKRTA